MISMSTLATASSPPHQDDHDLWETAANITSSADTSTTSLPISNSLCSAHRSNDVDEATCVMQGLSILQPPQIADNGGNYAQQFNTSAPVGPATASAHGPLDPVLVAGLENARERMTLLKFEDQIVRFLKNPKEPHLNFPPLSSYHRLIVHRLAQRCGLEHQTADYNPYDNSSSRVVTLYKTPQSTVPLVLLIDLSTDRQALASTPASTPRIMMRKRSALRPGANGGRGNSADKATPSLQDRERAYAEARARIFGEEINSTAAESVVIPSATVSLMHEDPRNDTGLGDGGSRHGSRQAAGPDGSKGFGHGRGSTSLCDKTMGSRPRSPKARHSAHDSTVYSSSTLPSAPNAASWKESKVLWRNREQEMNDPDFTRNHDAFRPRSSGGASSGSGSGGESPHIGHRVSGGMVRYGLGDYQSHQYDRSYDQSYDRSFGYQHQQNAITPPPPMLIGSGRGRYYIGGPEFNNRVDLNQYQRSPPHPQLHHQLNPPLSMLMGRGGYGIPSPHGHPSAQQGNWLPPHANSRVVGSSSNGFIDDDFPPLGK